MIEKISFRLLAFVAKYTNIDADLYDVYKYGIEISISSFLNIFLVLLLSLMLGDFIGGIVFLVCFIWVRSYCGGYHANSYFKCNSLMLVLYCLAFIISKKIECFINKELVILIILVVLVLSSIPVFVFSPVKNKHKNLTESNTKKCRIMSLVSFSAFATVGLILNLNNIIYGSIIIITLAEISVMILVEIIKQRRERRENKGSSS